MLLSVADIKKYWDGPALNIDDSADVEGGKTAFDLFIEREGERVTRRLKKWVGADALADAASDSPVDADRAQALRESELNLFHVQMIEQMGRVSVTGVEKDIQFPSGMRLSFAIQSKDDLDKAVTIFVHEAYAAVVEWVVS